MSGNSAVILLQCYNAFWYVLQRTAGPSETNDILKYPEQFCSLYSVRTCFLSSFFCMLLSFADTANGWLHLPCETRGMLSRLIVGDGMFGSRSLASLLPHCHCCPPFKGSSDFFDYWFVIAADSQEDDHYVHEGPLRADLRGL